MASGKTFAELIENLSVPFPVTAAFYLNFKTLKAEFRLTSYKEMVLKQGIFHYDIAGK
jgi:hypothetical protein